MDFLDLDRLRYLGGHPHLPNPIGRVRVVVGWDGVSVYDRRLRDLLDVEPEQISALTVADGAVLRFRWAQVPDYADIAHLPDRDAAVLGVITLFGDLAFECPGFRMEEVRLELQRFESMPAASSVGHAPSVPVSSADHAVSDPATDRRARLLEPPSLHDDGIITDDEYAKRRAAIIAEI